MTLLKKLFIGNNIRRKLYRCRHLPAIESLEHRILLAGVTAEWEGTINNDFEEGENWSTDNVPSAGDTALFKEDANIDVTGDVVLDVLKIEKGDVTLDFANAVDIIVENIEVGIPGGSRAVLVLKNQPDADVQKQVNIGGAAPGSGKPQGLVVDNTSLFCREMNIGIGNGDSGYASIKNGSSVIVQSKLIIGRDKTSDNSRLEVKGGSKLRGAGEIIVGHGSEGNIDISDTGSEITGKTLIIGESTKNGYIELADEATIVISGTTTIGQGQGGATRKTSTPGWGELIMYNKVNSVSATKLTTDKLIIGVPLGKYFKNISFGTIEVYKESKIKVNTTSTAGDSWLWASGGRFETKLLDLASKAGRKMFDVSEAGLITTDRMTGSSHTVLIRLEDFGNFFSSGSNSTATFTNDFTVEVKDSSQLITDEKIKLIPGAKKTSRVTVDGAPNLPESIWKANGGFYTGQSGKTVINVINGGIFETTQMELGANIGAATNGKKDGTVINILNGSRINASGDIEIGQSKTTTMTIASSTVTAGGDVNINANGKVIGQGGKIVSKNVNQNGWFKISGSTPTFEIHGNFTQFNTGTLGVDIEITDPALGVPDEYSVLSVTDTDTNGDSFGGNVILGGTLDIDLLGAFVDGIEIGDEFTVLTATEAINGTFDSLDVGGAELPDGMKWDVIYDSQVVILTVIEDPNLVKNGSFEHPEVTGHKGRWEYLKKVSGWTRDSGRKFEIQRRSDHPEDGFQYAELDARGSITISQILKTTAGKEYDFSFVFAGRPGTSLANNHLGFTVSDVGTGNTLLTGEELRDPDLGWETYTFTFTATSNETKISFSDLGPSNSRGTFLDDVVVVEKEAESAAAFSGPVFSAAASDDIVTNNSETPEEQFIILTDSVIDLDHQQEVSSDDQSVQKTTTENSVAFLPPVLSTASDNNAVTNHPEIQEEQFVIQTNLLPTFSVESEGEDADERDEESELLIAETNDSLFTDIENLFDDLLALTI